MGRRPVCLVCLFLMLSICFMDWCGLPLARGNPLPESVQIWIREHPDAVICGEVWRCSETEYSQSIYLKNTSLIYQSQKISIKNVRVFLKENEEVPVGTVLLLSGKLERIDGPGNPGEFDSRQYYACEHIYYFLKNAYIQDRSQSYSRYGQMLAELRQSLLNVLERAAGEDAGVFEAMILGEKSGLEDELRMQYQMAGIIHILAISGLHVSLMGMGFYSLLQKIGLGVWPAGLLALAGMIQYGMLTGAGVSALRAVCMFLLSIGARILGRTYDSMTAMAAAAILLLLDSPSYLYSSSFLLSFGAVAGIGTVSPVLQHIAGVRGKLCGQFLTSLAVQLTMLPVMLVFYGEVSVAGLLLNLFVLPTVGGVLICGMMGMGAGLFWNAAAVVILIPGRILLFIYRLLCNAAGRLPFGTWIAGAPQRWQIFVYYCILALVLFAGNRAVSGWEKVQKGQNFRIRRLCVLTAGGLFLMAGFCVLGYRSRGDLKITCLDVGQGDGIVLETPEGRHFLIDGGSSNKKKLGQYQLLPYLKNQGITRLDAVLISHTDMDHVSGVLELLEYMEKRLTSIKIDKLILPAWKEKPETYQELEELAGRAGVPVLTGSAGEAVRAGEVTFQFLAPAAGSTGADVNEDCMVFVLRYGEFQGLFTGDIGEKTEMELLSYFPDIDFLKTAHHGSRYSSSAAFLEKVKPELCVISCSDTNTYGHPSDETIRRLQEAGCQVEYTMKSGAVTIFTDGHGMRLRRYKTASDMG